MKVLDEDRELLTRFIEALEDTYYQIEHGMKTSDWDVFQSYIDFGATRIESRDKFETTPS